MKTIVRRSAQRIAQALIDGMPNRLFDPVRDGDRTIRVEELDLLTASPERRARFRDQMLHVQRGSYTQAVHGQVSNVDLEARLQAFVAGAADPSHDHYNFAIIFGDPAAPVGMAHAHARDVNVNGQPVEVIRASVNNLPEARGLRLTRVALLRLLRDYLRLHLIPRHPRFYAGYCMSPVMYAFMHHRLPRLVPGPDGPGATLTRSVHAALFGASMNANGLIAEHAGSRNSERTQAWLDANQDDPAVAYYLRKNPRYTEGFTLPVVVPLSFIDMAACIAQVARIEWARAR